MRTTAQPASKRFQKKICCMVIKRHSRDNNDRDKCPWQPYGHGNWRQSVTPTNKFTREHATCAKERAATSEPCSLLNAFRGMTHHFRSLCVFSSLGIGLWAEASIMTLISNLSPPTQEFFGPYKSMPSLILKSSSVKLKIWVVNLIIFSCGLVNCLCIIVFWKLLLVFYLFFFPQKSYVKLICQKDIRCIMHGSSQRLSSATS